MQKWSFFVMGAMTGVIAVLVTVLTVQPGAFMAHAGQIPPDPTTIPDPITTPGGSNPGENNSSTGSGRVSAAILGRGMQDPDMKLIAVPGMSTQGTQDCLWIVHKGALPVVKEDPKNPLPSRPTSEKITLAIYKIEKGGNFIKLVDVRDISYDLGFIQYEDEQKPSVKEVVEKIRKAQK